MGDLGLGLRRKGAVALSRWLPRKTSISLTTESPRDLRERRGREGICLFGLKDETQPDRTLMIRDVNMVPMTEGQLLDVCMTGWHRSEERRVG